MEPLSGLDASFLYLETPTLHMHVEMVTVFDPSTVPGGYSFAKMQAQIAVPHPPGAGLPPAAWSRSRSAWATRCGSTTPHFDIDYHVRRTAVPRPGGLLELADLAGDIASRQLDRAKPLWEIWIVEGLEDDRIAVIAKMHHSTVDGMSGAALLSVLFDLEPGELPARSRRGPPGRRPAGRRRIPSGARAHQRGDGGPGRPALRDHPGHPAHRPAPAQRPPGPQRAGHGRTRAKAALPLSAPRTSFNSTLTRRRRWPSPPWASTTSSG